MKECWSKDTVCSVCLGVALIACILFQYSTEVACALGGALGGAIASKHSKNDDKED